jgi:glutamate-1-semialdehyde 2,1-aminomutase
MTTRRYDKTQALRERAKEVLPLGVSSNFRYWGPTTTPVTARAEGCHTWDADGNRYIDYRLGFGPIILGHAHPAVNNCVAEAMSQGTITAALTEQETVLAERITRMCPGVELLRFANSGTEATMHALRIARAHTGREKVIKFEGQYHGMHDYVLWSTASADPNRLGPRSAPVPYKQSDGIPACIRELILTLPYNDFDVLESTLKREGHKVAAILVEPILGNAASIGPKKGWLEFLRQKCDEYGIVLLFDEVKTGFRIAPGGAQECFGVQADLATYAKAIANGFPLAAIGGKRAVMDVVGKGVSQGGTYCANAVGVAAGNATLELLEDGTILKAIDAQGRRLQAGFGRVLTEAGIAHQIQGPGAMFGVMLVEGKAVDFRAFSRHNAELYKRICMELVARGVIVDPDAREPWFLSAAHDDAAMDETLKAFDDAVQAAKG